MKRTLIWTAAIILGLLALLIIVPLTIDWGRFKPQVLAAVEAATGRKVTIAGDLSFRLLPNPRLVADKVRVAGFGAAPEALAEIDTLGIGVALRPLFDGKVEARYIHLGKPRLNLITYADGTVNWQKPETKPARKASLSLQDVRIRDGSVMLKDMRDGGTQNITGIRAKVALPDLAGPLAFEGKVTLGKLPLQAAGSFHNDVLDVTGNLDGGLAAFSFKGKIGDTISGTLTANMLQPAAFAARFSEAGKKSTAPALGKPLALRAEVTKAAKGIRLENLVATIDTSTLQGVLDVALSGRTKITGRIAADRIALKDWSSADDTPTTFPYKLTLPKHLDADLALTLARVILERGVVQNVATRVVLNKGMLTLDRTTVALPAGAQLTVAGTIKPVNGFARVSANASVQMPQLRSTLAAFGLASLPPIVDGLSGATSIELVGDRLSLRGIKASADGARMAGTVTAGLGTARDVDVALTIDRLDADRLQARLKAAPKSAAGNSTAATVKFAILVDDLKSGGKSMGRVTGQGVYRRADDAVDLARFSIANVAGYQVRGQGSIMQLSKTPETDLALTASGKNLTGTIALAGPQAKLATHAQLNYAGALVDTKGTVNAAAPSPAFDFVTTVRAQELTSVLNRLATKADPTGRPLGSLTLSMALRGTSASAQLQDITGSLGPVSLSGNASLILNRAKPDIQGNFVLGDVPLRAFLGPKETGAAAARLDAADRWSRAPLDFSGFAAITGKIALAAKRLTLDAYVFDAPRATLLFDGTGLQAQDMTAELFGGKFAGSTRLGSGPVPAVAATFSITGVPLQKIEEAFMASQPATGTAKIQGRISGSGASQYALVQNLSGAGTLASEQGIIRKVNLRRVNDRMKELGTVNDFIKLGVAAIQGGETAYRYLQADWNMSHGIVTVQPISSDMDGGNVSGKAVIDLPRWQVAGQILIKLDDFTQAPPVGMTMNGPLTAPVTKYDFLALQKYFGVRAANAGVKAIVKGEGYDPKDLLGIRKKPPADAPPAQTPSGDGTTPAADTPPRQAAAPKTPEQELKDTVLQGLGGLIKKKKPPAQPAPASQVEPQPEPQP